MSITESIKDYLKNTVNGGDQFDYWLDYNIKYYFGKDFLSYLKREIREQEEGEDPIDAIESAVEYALYDLTDDLKSRIEDIAHETADSDQRVIYTGQYIDYFIRNSRCEEICFEQGLTSTPEDPYSHMQTAVYYAIREDIAEGLGDDLDTLERILPNEIVEAIDWAGVIA